MSEATVPINGHPKIMRSTVEQYDGALWQETNFPGGFIILTSSGQEFVHEHPEFWQDFNDYRKAKEAQEVGSLSLDGTVQTRAEIGRGSRAIVYTFGKDCVVKEIDPLEPEQAGFLPHPPLQLVLQGMDKLQDAMQHGTPDWMGMPKNYGMIRFNGRPGRPAHEYLLMQRVDAGITTRDILEPENSTPEVQERLKREFKIGNDTTGAVKLGALREEVARRYLQVEAEVSSKLQELGLDPRKYLDDYHRRNVLVESLATPVARSHMKLWVIDQYLPERYRTETLVHNLDRS